MVLYSVGTVSDDLGNVSDSLWKVFVGLGKVSDGLRCGNESEGFGRFCMLGEVWDGLKICVCANTCCCMAALVSVELEVGILFLPFP